MIINLPDTDELTDAVAKIQDELTANNTKLYFDYQNGKYGYNTDPNRGADTFNPFRSGGSESPFTQLTTVPSVRGNELPTIYGNGYITFRCVSTTADKSDAVYVYIDGNSQSFPVTSSAINMSTYVVGGFYKLYFQKSIRFTGGTTAGYYFYQTLLSETPLDDKYNIVQGISTDTDYTTITGKGVILIAPSKYQTAMTYAIDGSTENTIYFYGQQYIEFLFNESVTFKSIRGGDQYLFYIAYTEI